MKKICKAAEPDGLKKFRRNQPDADWDDLRSTEAYKTIKEVLFQDQGHLCAFCESRLPADCVHQQRIEHFHPKSDRSDPDHNWALDWQNMIGVCMGGSRQTEDEKTSHPLPANLSCDAHKDHMITKGRIPVACEGYVLNPLDILHTPALFLFHRATCELRVAEDACKKFDATPPQNNYASVKELVHKTIEILNLNCPRLVDSRRAVLRAYNQAVARARKKNDRQFRKKLAKEWFRHRWPSFFTTRRLLLGQAAEDWLAEHSYQG